MEKSSSVKFIMMKYLPVFVLFMFLSCSDDDSTSENLKIYEGSVSLSSQEEVNAFGEQNYDVITEVLSINDNNNSTPVTNLGPLNSISKVQTFYVQKTSELENLVGLDGLTTAENGGIVITENQKLTSLEGLENLSTIDNIVLIDNPSLQTISSLSNINATVERLIIRNTNLENLEGLNNLTRTTHDLAIEKNNQLKNLDGLTNLIEIERCYILDNPVLADYCGLEALISDGQVNSGYSVSGNEYNPSLEELKDGDCN